jgi:polygalacturonase
MKIFNTIAALEAASLKAGQLVRVKGVGLFSVESSGAGYTLANGNKAVIEDANIPDPSDVTSGTQPTAATTSYVPAGTGAVTTDVQSKLRETVSVKDFGAVGDGVTDDTVAIQAAIDSSNTVLIPNDGVYICKNLNLNSNLNIILNGTLKIPDNSGSDGGNATMFNASGTAPTFDVNGDPSGFAFENITITGTGTIDGNSDNLADRFDAGGSVQFYGHLVTMSSVHNLVVKNISIIDASGFALAINNCKDVVVGGCKILTGPHRAGNSNYFNGRNQDGLHTVNCHNVIVEGNLIESGDDAINIESTSVGYTNATSRNVVVANNALHQNMGNANRDSSVNDYRITAFNFKVDPVSDGVVESVTFQGNLIIGRNGGSKAISIGAGSANSQNAKQIKVVDNTIAGFTDLGTPAHTPDILIRIIETDGLEFHGNSISGFARQFQIFDVSNVSIKNNTIKDQSTNALGNPNNYLFNINRVFGAADDVVISNNEFINLLGGCVSATSSSNSMDRFQFTDNKITECANGNTSDAKTVTYAVINVESPAELEFSRNSVYNHAAALLLITGLTSGGEVKCVGNNVVELGNNVAALNAEAFSIKKDVGTVAEGSVTLLNNTIEGTGGLAVELVNIKRVCIMNNQFNDIDKKNNINSMYLNYSGSASDLVTTDVQGVIANNMGSNSNVLSSGAIRVRTEQLVSSLWSGSVFQIRANNFSNTSSSITYQTGSNGDATSTNVVNDVGNVLL